MVTGQLKLVFFLVSFFLMHSINAQTQSTVIGDAIDQGDNCFTITPDQLGQVGGVWFSNPIDFDEDFTIYSQNNFGTKDGNGSDGVAFVFKASSIPEIGSGAGGLGYGGITNSLIVEFDTFRNTQNGDPVFDHLAILRDGNISHNAATALTPPVQVSDTNPNIEDGIDHEVKIVWTAATQTLEVYFDCVLRESLTTDIKTNVFNGDDTVFFGFVGATGGLSNLQEICFNSISFVDDFLFQDETICNGDFITVDASWPSGVTYSWSPTTGVASPNSPVTTISPTVTTTYTVTILDNCGDFSTEDITITVQDIENPVFDPIPNYCNGDTIPDLPLISNNGISGTWSPAIDNTQTTTYTFTPDADECAAVATLQIVVNPNVVPTFDGFPQYCSGDVIPELPTTSNNGIEGTWSPAIDNTQTTTYTFTPNADECAEVTTLQIVVNPNVLPTFDDVPEYCSGDVIPELPTTSNNGISGNWTPAIDNTQTTSYTFTPNDGQCGTVVTLDIIVNPLETPLFNAVSDKCVGDPIPDLPTISTNGISGTWSPPIDNTQTTTYTFTPNADECAEVTTLQIVVNPTVDPVFDDVPQYCSGDAIPDLPTTSNNGIVGTWSPAIDNSQTTTYTFTPTDAAQCSTTTTLDIVVNPLITPVFDSYPVYNAGDAIPPLPTTSNNGITGTWSPAINNTQTTTYTFTPDDNQCATSQTLTIVVISVDTDGDGVDDIVDIDDDNDGILDENEQGFASLDSASFNPFLEAWQTTNIDVFAGEEYQINPTGFSLPQVLVTGGPYSGQVVQQAVVFDNNDGRWADLDGNTYNSSNVFIGVESPTGVPFANLQASDYSTQLTYVGLVDTNGNGTYDVGIDEVIHPIFSVDSSITITPNVSGELFIVFADSFYSDNAGSLSFITSVNTDIDSDGDGIINRMDLDADNDGIPDNVEAQSSQGYIAPSGISAGITDIDGDGLDDNYDLDTNSPSTETSVGLIPQDTDADTTEDFIDSDSDDDGILDILENGLADAISNPFADADGDGIDDVFDVFDGFDVNNNIADPTTDLPDCNNNVLTDGDLDYREDLVLPTFDVPGPICAGDTLDDLPTTSNNGITGSWSPAIDNTQTTTYTFTPDDPSCGLGTSLEIVVNQPVTPAFDAVGPICNGEQLDELPTTSNNGIEGNWSPPLDNTQTTTYTFTPNDAECAIPATLEIIVEPVLIPEFDDVGPFCNGDAIDPLPTTSNNGISGTWSPDIDNTQTTTYTFTPNADECGEVITLQIEIIDNFTPEFDFATDYCIGDAIPALPTTSVDGITGSWSPAVDNTITTTYTFTPDPDQGCPTETSVTITIDQGTTPEFAIIDAICEGDDLEPLPTVSEDGFTGSWSPALNNMETTTYTFTPDDGQCALETDATITVNPINEIALIATVISEPFDQAIVVQLNVSGGNGDYEYRVNGGPWQSSNTFSGLTGGTQIVFEARQINGCSNVATATAIGLTFPTFFTPNGDGFNEFWNIKSLRNQSDAVIYIFDRYGKLLVQILPTQAGWDGYYKGKPMPSQDYWFRVEFNDLVTGNRTSYNNHFTLKR